MKASPMKTSATKTSIKTSATKTIAKSQSVPHDSSWTHVQGSSEYVDDRPVMPNELHVGIAVSDCAHATIKKIDFSEAQKIKGFHSYYTAKDFLHNVWGTIFQDQPLIADKTVQFVGETVAIVAAETREALRLALQKVSVSYEELPAILSIQEARKQKSFIGPVREISRGSVDKVFSQNTLTLTGKIVIRGAEHFYLENQSALSYPQEQGALEVHSSSQHPTEVQHVISHSLGLDSKDVVCVVKRMGGAFGGKESQAAPLAAYPALVTHLTGRPARLVLDKDMDVLHTGKRNPFENEYKVAFDATGKILALDCELYSDAGAYADLSTSIMERAMLHADNAYFIPHFRVRGQVCKTHYHPHTAFRGFGGPKGVLMIEKIIEEIAQQLNLDPLDLRMKNVYRGTKNVTPYGQKIKDNCLPQLFKKLRDDSSYNKRRKEIEKHNKRSRDMGVGELRGLSLTPVKFGIAFTTKFLNQGNALVNVYRDGTIQVSTGATEMGQGVYSRIRQIVADELGVDTTMVRVMPTSTEKNANTSPTAASSGTDINGAAAALACQKIKFRLAQVAKILAKKNKKNWPSKTGVLGSENEIDVTELGKATSIDESSKISGAQFANNSVHVSGLKISFAELCNEAYMSRVSLCEYAHYKMPNLGFDKLKGQGDAFLYFTQGVAASEVSLCQLSGEVKVLRSDILMDLGRPINKELDLGQVMGGFVQGLGWMLLERLHYKKGRLLSVGPSTYKIPSIHDIPREFNVNLLPNEKNKVNIRASKAVGEPPLLLAVSVWTAVLDALRYKSKKFADIEVPASAEHILKVLHSDKYEELALL